MKHCISVGYHRWVIWGSLACSSSSSVGLYSWVCAGQSSSFLPESETQIKRNYCSEVGSIEFSRISLYGVAMVYDWIGITGIAKPIH